MHTFKYVFENSQMLPFGLALLVGYGLSTGGLVKSPLLVAIILCAPSLGVVSPVLEHAFAGTPACSSGWTRHHPGQGRHTQ